MAWSTWLWSVITCRLPSVRRRRFDARWYCCWSFQADTGGGVGDGHGVVDEDEAMLVNIDSDEHAAEW